MKKLLVFLAVIFFSPHYFALANLQINEIMYDLKTGSDDGREWIEIYNDSDLPIDLSSFRFFEADANHKLKLAQGSTNIEARSYAIIASNPLKFRTDWPGFVGGIFDSSFSLSNDGETLAIKSVQPDKSLKVIDQYTYRSSLGAAGDSKSLQKINGVWFSVTPTPGGENKIEKKNEIKAVAPVVKSKPVPEKEIITSFEPEGSQSLNGPPRLEVEAPLLNQGGDGGGNSLAGLAVESTSFRFPIILLILLLIASLGAVYFVRKKRVVSKAGDDFKILDE